MTPVARFGTFGVEVFAMAKSKNLVSVYTVAEALDLPVETIMDYTRRNFLPCIKTGNQISYSLPDVLVALAGSALVEDSVNYVSKPFTYRDYLKLPEEPGYRFEVLNGLLIKDPSPTVRHQRVIGKLYLLLANHFRHIKGEIFLSPLDVTFGELTVVQPDILYVSGEQMSIIKKKRIDGAPALAIEVISASSRRKDRIHKMQIYLQAGVRHYWLVDPAEKTFDCFILQDQGYVPAATGSDDDTIIHPQFPGLAIPLETLW